MNKCALCGDFMPENAPHACLARIGNRITGAPETNWRVIGGHARGVESGEIHYTVKLNDDPEHMITAEDLKNTIRALLAALEEGVKQRCE